MRGRKCHQALFDVASCCSRVVPRSPRGSSYASINGVPSCGSTLLTSLVRETWGRPEVVQVGASWAVCVCVAKMCSPPPSSLGMPLWTRAYAFARRGCENGAAYKRVGSVPSSLHARECVVVSLPADH